MNLDLGGPREKGSVHFQVWHHKVRQCMLCMRVGTKRLPAHNKRNEGRDFHTSKTLRNLLQKFRQFGQSTLYKGDGRPTFLCPFHNDFSHHKVGRVAILFCYFHFPRPGWTWLQTKG